MSTPCPPTLRLCRRRPEARINGKRVKLTWRQWQLIGFLYDRGGEIVSNAELCDLYDLDTEHDACEGYILHNVYFTRRALKRAGYPNLIKTVTGQGYRLVTARKEPT